MNYELIIIFLLFFLHIRINIILEMTSWRQEFFNQLNCQGIINYSGEGELTVNGQLKGYEGMTVDIIYWAAAPATRGMSFSGSGLPYANPAQAFDQSPNQGSTKCFNGQFTVKLRTPNAYYVGLGTLYVPPMLHVKVCGDNSVHHIPITHGIPFRTLTYPSPPTNKPRSSAMFYCTGDLPVRSQEQILRDSAYKSDQPMPDDFWALRPAR
jgi:hypothetical protein